MKVINAVIERLSDWMNPIVVKELRQVVQSRFVLLLVLFPIVVFLIMGIYVLDRSITLNIENAMTFGSDAFRMLFIILVYSCMIAPMYTAGRLFQERSGNNIDLFFITNLRPGMIIRGKLLAGAFIAILLFSLCMPFMAFTYLLRGIDIPSILAIMVITFIGVLITTQFSIFIACLPASRPFRALLGLMAGGAIFAFSSYMSILGLDVLRSGIRGLFASSFVIWIVIGWLMLVCLCNGFFYVISLIILSPASANRSLWFRLYISIVWLITGIMIFVLGYHEKQAGFIFLWSVPSIVIFSMLLFIAISEEDLRSKRVMRTIPSSKFRRFIAFLFFNGAVNGIAWSISMILLTYGVVTCFLAIPSNYTYFTDLQSFLDEKIFEKAAIGVLYVYCYAMCSHLIRRKVLKRWLKPKYTGVIGLGVLGLCSIVPYIIVAVFIYKGKAHFFDYYKYRDYTYYFNVFDTIECNKEQFAKHLKFVLAWTGIVTALQLPWFIKETRGFFKAKKEEKILPNA